MFEHAATIWVSIKKQKAALETRAAFLMPDKATYVAGTIELILNTSTTRQ
jgi:hypothetical protein